MGSNEVPEDDRLLDPAHVGRSPYGHVCGVTTQPAVVPAESASRPVIGLDFDYLLSAGDQRLPSARRVKYLSDGINRHLGIVTLPYQTRVCCSLHAAVNTVDRERSKLSIELGPDASRLIVWCSRAYDD